MEYASLLVLLALLQYFWFTSRVGATRAKYGVEAPACTGHPEWERLFRIQQNTMEQLVMFVPATYVFAWYVSSNWVLLPGVIYLLGRFLYASTYFKDPGKRTAGMVMTMLSSAGMIGVALVVLLIHMF